MRSILLVTPYLPYASVTHAGGKAVYDFIRHLKKRSTRVYLIAMTLPAEERFLKDVRALCDDAVFLTAAPALNDDFVKRLFRNPLEALAKLPEALGRHFSLSARMRRAVLRMEALYHPEVVQVEFSIMALYLGKIKTRGLTTLHLHDVMAKPLRRLYEAERDRARRWLRGFLWRLWEFLELRFSSKFDLLLAMSEFDRQWLFSRGLRSVAVQPCGMELPDCVVSAPSQRPRGSVLFVGAMDRELNEAAALFFIERVLPIILSAHPDTRFYVVGNAPRERLRRLASQRVVVTGYAEDLTPYYQKSLVFVAPLFVGGGLICKIVQAMSFGVPVVATSVANEGIRAVDEESILLAETPEQFAGKIIRVQNDSRLWHQLSEAGLSLVRERFSWDSILDRYFEDCRRGIDQKKAPKI
jgi:glycosyltransferase involved in cell wall biosynthesis